MFDFSVSLQCDYCIELFRDLLPPGCRRKGARGEDGGRPDCQEAFLWGRLCFRCGILVGSSRFQLQNDLSLIFFSVPPSSLRYANSAFSQACPGWRSLSPVTLPLCPQPRCPLRQWLPEALCFWISGILCVRCP